MEHLKPPGPLLLEGSKAVNWNKWIQRWENYAIATGLKTKEATVQTATFLHVVGEDALEIYNNFKWSEGQNKSDLKTIVEQFEKYCIPRRNITFERHVFNTRFQSEGESIDSFMKALQTQSQKCEYGELSDSLIRDRIVAGVRDDRIRQRLLERCDLNLESAIEVVRAAEASKQQARSFHVKMTEKENALLAEVDAIKAKKKAVRKDKNSSFYSSKGCGKCGKNHMPKKCPAWGQTCYKCQGRNHFANVCKGKKSNRNVAAVHEYDIYLKDEDEAEELTIGQITTEDETKDWVEKLTINKKVVHFKLDTGAQCSIIPKRIYDELTDEPLEKTKVKLVSYTKDKINPLGQKELACYVKGTRYRTNFQIVPDDFEAILGRKDCVKMRLIKKLQTNMVKVAEGKEKSKLEEDYPDVFEGLGKLDGEYHITLDPNVPPVVHPPRRVPHALKKKLKVELERMETLGIIKQVPDNEPSDWVNSLVLVDKPNGELRICIDPRNLNQAIKREHHPLPTVEEVAAKVQGAQYFTVLDAKNAFYQVCLDEQSSKLLTFNTPYGRYRYLRMPMGIKSAPEIYQRKIQEAYEGLDGIEVVMDDALIWGKDDPEHDRRLEKAMKRAQEKGLKLNPKKCKVKQTEIKYLGHKFTREGLKLDDERVRAVKEMPPPTDKTSLQRFLGMLNYVGKFIPNMSQLTAPLRELLEKNVQWHWTSTHKDAYETLLNKLVEAPVLAYYDPEEALTLQVDASSKGLGATLLQNGRPVAYASKSLTSCQQNYAQIEKELLAIVFGCTKFDEYILWAEEQQ